jgi:hypothetical protein
MCRKLIEDEDSTFDDTVDNLRDAAEHLKMLAEVAEAAHLRTLIAASALALEGREPGVVVVQPDGTHGIYRREPTAEDKR